MILSFKSGVDPLLVGVGKNRELSIASSASDFVFVRVESLGTLRAFKPSEKRYLADLLVLVKSFGSDTELVDYLKVEMGKLGFVFVREMSVDEYLDLTGYKDLGVEVV